MTEARTMLRWPLVVVCVAALHGAAGVAFSAAAAHIENSANLATASQFLLIHAAAALALAAIAGTGFSSRRRWLAGAILALQAGVTLFAADLAARALLGTRLFPYAAPTGGSLLIASWLALALWAALAAAAKPRVGE